MNINWAVVIVGYIIAVILSIIFGMFAGILGTIGITIFSGPIAYIMATTLVGYTINENYWSGAVHGALVGLIGVIIGLIIGIPFVLTPLIFAGTGTIFLQDVIFGILVGSIFSLIVNIVIGGIGGAIGVFLSNPNKFYFKVTIPDSPLLRENIDKYSKIFFKFIKINLSEFFKFIEVHLNEFIFKKSKNNNKGYIVCQKCESYYQLQPHEFPEDFSDKYECGGRFRHVKTLMSDESKMDPSNYYET